GAGDGVIGGVKPRIAELSSGPGGRSGKDENELGPVVSGAQQQKVVGDLDKGGGGGATLVMDGRNYSVAGYPEGLYVGGTLFDNVTPEMTIWREEIFCRVLGIVRVPDYATAISAVNSHELGHGTVIFTPPRHH
ncbi:aldehyde dehydrogenase family protein, partial [Salmonella enterica]|uniref:aldehyde dehydrogenase family protein n=1 Tax=Salmonella enterica TaxID=28901 RepID=UPI00398C24DC